MKSVHIVARKNGVGIDRDVAIMEAVLSSGHDVDYRSQKRPESLWKQIVASMSSRQTRDNSDLYLLTERIPFLLGRLPGCVALVPNQERFPKRHTQRLKHVDHILCKTRHAETVFSGFGPAVHYVGFTSFDRQLADETPDYSRFFHLAGRSTLKGTATLLAAWSRHPEWPQLTLVQAPENAPANVPKNVRLITEFIPDNELCRMQNRHGIHLCPSLSEGWGHYIVEAMSCSAVVVTTDGPPMNELVTADRGVCVPWHNSAPRHLGTNWHVSVEAIEAAVESVIAMTNTEKMRLGRAARRWFEVNDIEFRHRFADTVSKLFFNDSRAEPLRRAG